MGLLETLVEQNDMILKRMASLEKVIAEKVVSSKPVMTRKEVAAAWKKSIDWCNTHPELMPPYRCGAYATEEVMEWAKLDEAERKTRYAARLEIRSGNKKKKVGEVKENALRLVNGI